MKLLENPTRMMDENGQIIEIYDRPERSKREDSNPKPLEDPYLPEGHDIKDIGGYGKFIRLV